MKLAILCSGQAGQRCTMLDGVFADPDCAELLALAGDVLGRDVERWWRGLSEPELFHNANAQFAIALYQIAMWSRIAARVPLPQLIAGYSLGEVLAYFVAGALDAGPALRLVRERARLMDAAASGMATAGGCMLLWRGATPPAVRAARDRALLANGQQSGLQIAIRRSADEMVLAGDSAAVERFLADPEIVNPQLVRLPVTTPSHTSYLAPAAAAFAEQLAASALGAPRIAVLGGLSAAPVRTRAGAIAALSAQISGCLRWDLCMEALVERGVDTVIELGPGSDLCKLFEMRYPQVAARSLDAFADPRHVADWLDARHA